MMTVTIGSVTPKRLSKPQGTEMDAVTEVVRMAKEQGLALTGPSGLLKQMTKTVIETAFDEEMTEHLRYESKTQRASNLRPVIGLSDISLA